MSVDYRLTLAGDIPVEEIAECAVPDSVERPRPWGNSGRLLGSDLYDQRGFGLTVRAGEAGYYEARDDGGATWEWEPDYYVNVTFEMSKDDLVDKGTPSMLAIVARVLAARPEDAALILNGEVLLLTRVDGAVRKHNRATWWDHYGFANDIVVG